MNGHVEAFFPLAGGWRGKGLRNGEHVEALLASLQVRKNDLTPISGIQRR